MSSKLEQKLAKNRALGQRTEDEIERAIVEEYANTDASYRDLAAKHRKGLGTVMRIIRRARLPRSTSANVGDAAERRGVLLREALELLDTRTGRRKALGKRIRTELGLP